jgi:hypothetical protein
MIGAAGLMGVATSAVGTWFAERFPNRVEAIETCAGFLLIASFALVGCALPVML